MSQSLDLKPAETIVCPGQKYKRHTRGTYVGLIAYVIQDSPNRRLTFKQIMDKMGVYVTGDRKGLENNIRVCLSSNKCFVKEPVDPDYPNAKRNFWKVDESSITPKMLRRHFRDIAEMFPGLLPILENCTNDPALSVCAKENKQGSVKFNSPFSIESLLKKDCSTQRNIQSVQDHIQFPVLAKGLQNVLKTDSWSNQHYTYIRVTGTEHRQYSEHCMNRLEEKSTVNGSWRKPVQGIDLM